jgi:hypothetical protein
MIYDYYKYWKTSLTCSHGVAVGHPKLLFYTLAHNGIWGLGAMAEETY